MPAPTFPASVDLAQGTGTRSFAAVTTQAGDYLVVDFVGEDGASITGATVTVAGLTFTVQNNAGGANDVRVTQVTAPDAAGGSRTVSVTPTGANPGNWIAHLTVVRGSAGPGTGKATSLTGQTVSVTRQGANSAMFMAIGDWSAGALGTPVWTPGGATIVTGGTPGVTMTAIVGRWDDSGSTGTANHGISSPSYTTPTIAVLEMLGAAAPAVFIRGTTPATTIVTGTNPYSVTLTGTRQPQAGDVLVIIAANDFYAMSAVNTPTVGGSTTGVTAITGASADGGTDLAHVKAWSYVVATTGDLTVSETETAPADEEKALIVYVLGNVDTSTPIDGSGAGASGATSTSQVAPAVSPGQTNSFLISHVSTGGAGTAATYTPPAGMSEAYDTTSTGFSISGATVQLSASGSTGTKTFTASATNPWGAISIAVKTLAVSSVITSGPSPQWTPGFMVSMSGLPAALWSRAPGSSLLVPNYYDGEAVADVAGNNFTQSLNANLTFTSADSLQTGHDEIATLSFTSSDIFRTVKTIAATLGSTGALTRAVVLHALTATLAFVGGLTTAAVHHFTQALTATLNFTGVLPRAVRTNLAGLLSFVGTQTRATRRTLSGSLAFSGTIPRAVSKQLTAAVSFGGALSRRISHVLLAALSFTGILTTAAVRHFTQALNATLSFTGSLTTAAVHVFTQALTATLGFTSSIKRAASHVQTASVSFTGTLPKSTSATRTATLGFTGAQTRRITSVQVATLSFIGSLLRRVPLTLTATLSFTGAFTTQTVRVITQALTAALSFTSAQTRAVVHTQAASVSFTSAVLRRATTPRVASLSFTSAQSRRVSKVQTAAVSFAGSLLRRLPFLLTATLSFTGSLTTAAVHFFTKALTATLSFTGSLVSQRVIARALAATFSFTSSLSRSTRKLHLASLSVTSAQLRRVTTTLRSNLMFGGLLTVVPHLLSALSNIRVRIFGQEAAKNVAGREGPTSVSYKRNMK